MGRSHNGHQCTQPQIPLLMTFSITLLSALISGRHACLGQVQHRTRACVHLRMYQASCADLSFPSGLILPPSLRRKVMIHHAKTRTNKPKSNSSFQSLMLLLSLATPRELRSVFLVEKSVHSRKTPSLFNLAILGSQERASLRQIHPLRLQLPSSLWPKSKGLCLLLDLLTHNGKQATNTVSQTMLVSCFNLLLLIFSMAAQPARLRSTRSSNTYLIAILRFAFTQQTKSRMEILTIATIASPSQSTTTPSRQMRTRRADQWKT